MGDAHDAPAVQIAADPAADFHQCGAQQADVNPVAARIADLTSVPDRVELRKSDRERARNTGQHILQSDGHASAGHSEGKAEAAQAIFKQDGDEKKNRDVARKDHELANSIAFINAAKVSGQRLFEHAKAGMNQDRKSV